MLQSHLLQGVQVSDTENAKLTIEALNPGTPEEEWELDILHRAESVGTENCAYLVFGVPGTGTYSFMDLNRLPDEVKVCITMQAGEQLLSRSEFSGTTGNMPLPLEG